MSQSFLFKTFLIFFSNPLNLATLNHLKLQCYENENHTQNKVSCIFHRNPVYLRAHIKWNIIPPSFFLARCFKNHFILMQNRLNNNIFLSGETKKIVFEKGFSGSWLCVCVSSLRWSTRSERKNINKKIFQERSLHMWISRAKKDKKWNWKYT